MVEGPWSAALSEHVGTPLRLVESRLRGGRRRPRRRQGTVSLISRATLDRVPPRAGLDGALDARRFRMLFEIDGVEAHEEDDWLGRPLRLGEAVIMLSGHTGRCVVTTRDPESGVSDVTTLEAARALPPRRRHDGAARLRRPRRRGRHPGLVRVGDPVELV